MGGKRQNRENAFALFLHVLEKRVQITGCVCFFIWRTSWSTSLWPHCSTARPSWAPVTMTPSWRWCVKSLDRANQTCTYSSVTTSRLATDLQIISHFFYWTFPHILSQWELLLYKLFIKKLFTKCSLVFIWWLFHYFWATAQSSLVSHLIHFFNIFPAGKFDPGRYWECHQWSQGWEIKKAFGGPQVRLISHYVC